jgi:preprotein translocase subunit YajC
VELIQTLIFLVLMVGIFYFLLIRPERKRRQQHQELVGSLKRGDKVITMGGLCGVIKKVDRDRIWLEVEDSVTLKLVRDCVVEKEKAS